MHIFLRDQINTVVGSVVLYGDKPLRYKFQIKGIKSYTAKYI